MKKYLLFLLAICLISCQKENGEEGEKTDCYSLKLSSSALSTAIGDFMTIVKSTESDSRYKIEYSGDNIKTGSIYLTIQYTNLCGNIEEFVVPDQIIIDPKPNTPIKFKLSSVGGGQLMTVKACRLNEKKPDGDIQITKWDNITTNSVTIHTEITNSCISNRNSGFCISKNNNSPVIGGDNCSTIHSEINTLYQQTNITGFEDNQDYFLSAFFENEVGDIIYSNTIFFKTLEDEDARPKYCVQLISGNNQHITENNPMQPVKISITNIKTGKPFDAYVEIQGATWLSSSYGLWAKDGASALSIQPLRDENVNIGQLSSFSYSEYLYLNFYIPVIKTGSGDKIKSITKVPYSFTFNAYYYFPSDDRVWSHLDGSPLKITGEADQIEYTQ